MTEKAHGGRNILGTLRSDGGRGIVRIEDRYNTDIEDLWSALTDPSRVVGWYAQVEGDLRVGGEFRLFVESDGWEGTGRVVACEPPRRLLVTTMESEESWRKGQGAPPFEEVIEATLTADGNHVRLVIEVNGIPLDKVAYYGVGWQIHAEHLAARIAGREPDDAEPRWDQLIPPYLDMAAKIH